MDVTGLFSLQCETEHPGATDIFKSGEGAEVSDGHSTTKYICLNWHTAHRVQLFRLSPNMCRVTMSFLRGVFFVRPGAGDPVCVDQGRVCGGTRAPSRPLPLHLLTGHVTVVYVTVGGRTALDKAAAGAARSPVGRPVASRPAGGQSPDVTVPPLDARGRDHRADRWRERRPPAGDVCPDR